MSNACAEFARLVEIMATLRGPDGCPWDREQTFESLSQFVLEEAYEVVDAIERGDDAPARGDRRSHLRRVFLAQIARTSAASRVADSLAAVSDKLVRRHPHVFQDDGRVHDAASKERAPSADAALSRWDARRRRSRARRAGPRRRSAGCREASRPCCAPTSSASAPPPSASTGPAPATSSTRSRRRSRSCARPLGGRAATNTARRRGGDGRSALRHRQPVAQARHRAGGGAAEGERQVRGTIRRAWRPASPDRAADERR